MKFSNEEREAYNKECRRNYWKYNERIEQLEAEGEAASDPIKVLNSVKAIQKELLETDRNRKHVVKLFNFKDRPNRSQFFDRLNRLFDAMNQQNKASIIQRLESIVSSLENGDIQTNRAMQELKGIHHDYHAVPKSDPKKAKLKTVIDSAFDLAKSTSPKAFPNLDQITETIKKDIDKTQRKIRKLGQPDLSESDFLPSIDILKTHHKMLKDIQKSIRNGQDQLKKTDMSGESRHNYFKQFQALWEKQSECWNEPALTHRSNFCESLTSSNFRYFVSQIEDIEAVVESEIQRKDIVQMNGRIKTLENELKQSNKPLKFDQRKEFFARTWACKQRLQNLWHGITTVNSEQFDAIATQIQKLHKLFEKARSKPELEKVKEGCRRLHALRKEKLADQKLTPGQNHRIRIDTDELYRSATDLINKIAPQQFSFDWLKDAYQRNVENRWVIFVDDVPSV